MGGRRRRKRNRKEVLRTVFIGESTRKRPEERRDIGNIMKDRL